MPRAQGRLGWVPAKRTRTLRAAPRSCGLGTAAAGRDGEKTKCLESAVYRVACPATTRVGKGVFVTKIERGGRTRSHRLPQGAVVVWSARSLRGSAFRRVEGQAGGSESLHAWSERVVRRTNFTCIAFLRLRSSRLWIFTMTGFPQVPGRSALLLRNRDDVGGWRGLPGFLRGWGFYADSQRRTGGYTPIRARLRAVQGESISTTASSPAHAAL